MKRLTALVIALIWMTPARAEHADISLRLQRLDPATGMIKEEVSSHADQAPPPGGLVVRPLLKVKAKEPLVLQFFYTNTYPHGINKDVTVRYFLVREEKIKQKQVPDIAQGCVLQGEFQLNFNR